MSDCESETFDCESETSNVSDCETNNNLHSDTKYNPCIRKGKRKAKYVKKLKKYEAKAQKMNLIRSKTYKVINDNLSTPVHDETKFKALLEILKTKNIYEWNTDFEYLYTTSYKLCDIEEYVKQYEALKTAIEDDDKYSCSSYDSCDWEERYGRWTRREGRLYICKRMPVHKWLK
jgi:hypothetical protein